MPAKPYRPRTSLERTVVAVIVRLYRSGSQQPIGPMDIARALINDAAFIGVVAVPGPQRDRILLRGVYAIVANVVHNLRFIGGPYDGVKACYPVPVVGQKERYLQFAPRMTLSEWRAVADAKGAQAVALALARDEARAIVEDLERRGAETLEAAYGQMNIGL